MKTAIINKTREIIESSNKKIFILQGVPEEIIDGIENIIFWDKENYSNPCPEYSDQLVYAVGLPDFYGDSKVIISINQYLVLSQIASDFFGKDNIKSRTLLIKEHLRKMFPINPNQFVEETGDERPENLPDHHIKHVKFNDDCFYILNDNNLHGIEEYLIFNDSKELEVTSNENLKFIDIDPEEISFSYYLNELIKFDRIENIVFRTTKNLVTSGLKNRLEAFSGFLNTQSKSAQFYSFDNKITEKSYQPSHISQELGQKYWCKNGGQFKFNTLKRYKDPAVSRDVIDYSQGEFVDSLIEKINLAHNESIIKDMFITAPTGAGKSLLFQIPAFYVSEKKLGVTIVISPLVALMEDQVKNIKTQRGYSKVAYINSSLNLNQRNEVLSGVHEEKIDILYLSPELFLSYNISHFLADRKLSLLVVDEAHLITTWGRDFRADYWFLGTYLSKIKKYGGHKFVTATFTATAINGGTNDMVGDTMSSLGMNVSSEDLIIGQVKRDDIEFIISNYPDPGQNFRRNKRQQTIDFFEKLPRVKTLVYSPTRKLVEEFHTNAIAVPRLRNLVGKYHGNLHSNEKTNNLTAYSKGVYQYMIATKAFGMGIDISNIQCVYHHAPTGILPDYLQEVGRAAREEGMKGYALINFNERDKSYSESLVGMSSIRDFQIKNVIKKLVNVYEAEGEQRNLLISPEDFEFAFQFGNNDNEVQALGNKVKTALMMLEKDYHAEHGYQVLVARPKSLFSVVYATINNDKLESLSQFNGVTVAKQLGSKVVVRLDLGKIWQDNFANISFPQAKFKYYQNELFNSITLSPTIQFKFILKDIKNFGEKLSNEFNKLINALNQFNQNTQVEVEQLEKALSNQGIENYEDIAHFIANSFNVNGSNYFLFFNRYLTNQDRHVLVKQPNNVNQMFKSILSVYNDFDGLSNEKVNYVIQQDEEAILKNSLFGGLLDLLGFGTYEKNGGKNPKIFVRINDINKLKNSLYNPKYTNKIRAKVENKFVTSYMLYDHFFTTDLTNEQRWNFLEDYFLGADVNKLVNDYPGDKIEEFDLIEALKNKEPNNFIDFQLVNNEVIQPNPNQKYYGNNLLSLKVSKETHETKRLDAWVRENSIALYDEISNVGFKIESKYWSILYNNLVNNEPEYMKSKLWLDFPIEFAGDRTKVKAKVPYNAQPVKFYKWLFKDGDGTAVKLKLTDLIRLIEIVKQQKGLDYLIKKHRNL